jgi:hypothetical protein
LVRIILVELSVVELTNSQEEGRVGLSRELEKMVEGRRRGRDGMIEKRERDQ